MNSPLLIDTGAWIALLWPRDSLHTRASQGLTQAQQQHRSLLTTGAILLEVVDGLAGQGLRHLSHLLREQVRTSARLEVIDMDAALLQRGWDLFELRGDKEWSLTDCISFVVMEERGLSDALAYDHHFTQAGFRALLREI